MEAPDRKSPSGSAESRDYIFGLDGMRAAAILCVLLAHGFEQFTGLAHLPHWEVEISEAAGRLGTFGVKLFFAISGYLICSRLAAEIAAAGASTALKRFYIRRVFRILPPLIPYLLLLWVAGRLHWISVSMTEITGAAFFFSNYIMAHSWYTLHFWSLAVEEHFYVLWAPVLAVMGRTRAGWAAVAVIVLTAVFRPLILAHTSDVVAAMSQTQMVLDYFMFPCLLALGVRQAKFRELAARLGTPLVLFGLLLALAAVGACRERVSLPGLDLRTIEAGLFALIVVLPTLNPHAAVIRILEARGLRWIGKRSYGLYIWQQLFLVPSALPLGAKVLPFLFHSGLAIAVAAASYSCLEVRLVFRGRQLAKRVPSGARSIAPSVAGSGVVFENG
jgi:peptidoglycan/LPS O-acetylase OafA/YrhL